MSLLCFGTTAAADAVSAASTGRTGAAIGTADAFDTALLLFVDIEGGRSNDRSDHQNQNDIFKHNPAP